MIPLQERRKEWLLCPFVLARWEMVQPVLTNIVLQQAKVAALHTALHETYESLAMRLCWNLPTSPYPNFFANAKPIFNTDYACLVITWPKSADVLNFPTFWEFRGILCYLCVPWRQVHVYCRTFNRTLLTMAICVQHLDPVVLYAFLRLRGKATALKLKKKASMKHLSWLLMAFGKL